MGLLNSLAHAVRRHCWISSSGPPSGKRVIVIVVVVVVPLLGKLLGSDFAIFWEPIITTQRYFVVVVVPLLGKLLSSDFAIFTSPGPAAMSSMTFFFFFLASIES